MYFPNLNLPETKHLFKKHHFNEYERCPGPDIAVKTDHYSHGNDKPLKTGT